MRSFILFISLIITVAGGLVSNTSPLATAQSIDAEFIHNYWHNSPDATATATWTPSPTPSSTATLFVPTPSATASRTPTSVPTRTPTPIDSRMRPYPDGYQFQNIALESDEDFTLIELRRMFGDEAVCLLVINGNCSIVNPLAIYWESMVADEATQNGICFGMAATAARFYGGLEHPSQIQPRATITNNLFLEESSASIHPLRTHLAYYHVAQETDRLQSAIAMAIQRRPSETIEALKLTLAGNRSDYPIVFLWRSDKKSGHALVPYRIEHTGNGVYQVFVYDSNWPDNGTHPPNSTRTLTINTVTETWIYEFQPGVNWQGNVQTNSLAVLPISVLAEPYECPWCFLTGRGSASSQFISYGTDNVLVADEEDRRVGYANGVLVNEIPNAAIAPRIDGLYERNPVYKLPPTSFYNVQWQRTDEPLHIAWVGPGFGISLVDNTLEPTTNQQLRVEENGNGLTYEAQSARNIDVTLLQSAPDNTEVIQLEVRDFSLKDSTQIVRQEEGTLLVQGSRSVAGMYSFALVHSTNTEVKEFQHQSIPLEATDIHYLHYGAWNGNTGLLLEVDHGGDGSIDETIFLENETRPMFLPLIWRGDLHRSTQ